MTIFCKISFGSAVLAAILLALTGAMLTYEVVARYFFIRPTIWAAELSQLCLIWGYMLSMAHLLHVRRHITVHAVTNTLPRTGQHICRTLSLSFVMLFSSIVTIWGWKIFLDSFERGRTTGSLLDLPAWIAELAIPVGFFLLAVQAIMEMIDSGTSPTVHRSSHK